MFSTSGTQRTSKPSRSRSARSPSRRRPKRNVSPAATTSAPMPRSMRSANSSADSPASCSSKRSTSTSSDSRCSNSSSRRWSVASSSTFPSEHGTRMRVEGHEAGSQARGPRGVDHAEVTAVDAVEGPDRHGTPCRGQLAGARGRRSRDTVPLPPASAPRSRAEGDRVRTRPVRRRQRPRTARPPSAAATRNARRARSPATAHRFPK